MRSDGSGNSISSTQRVDSLTTSPWKSIQEEIDTLQRVDPPDDLVAALEKELRKTIRQKTDLVFNDDTTFLISSTQFYQIPFDCRIFLAEGEFLPSGAIFHIYGGYYELNNLIPKIYSMPVDIVTEFTSYKVGPDMVHVFGHQYDLAGLDNGEYPPKQESILFSVDR